MPIMTRINMQRYRTNEELLGTRWIVSSHAGYWGFHPEKESELTDKIFSGVYTSRMKAYDALRKKVAAL